MAEAMVQGIDVSHFQGTIDWAEVAKAGKAFAFIKATDGCGVGDPMFRANWSRARAAGLRRGAYHFFRAQQDAKRQAKHFIATLGDDRGELPPVLDFESLDDTSAEEALRGAQRWMELVEEASRRKPILYTGPAFWCASLHESSLLAEYPLWIAHYTVAIQPHVPSAWKRWTFWQHSEKGLAPGIGGPVDLDRFNGTLTELDLPCARIQEKSATIGG